MKLETRLGVAGLALVMTAVVVIGAIGLANYAFAHYGSLTEAQQRLMTGGLVMISALIAAVGTIVRKRRSAPDHE